MTPLTTQQMLVLQALSLDPEHGLSASSVAHHCDLSYTQARGTLHNLWRQDLVWTGWREKGRKWGARTDTHAVQKAKLRGYTNSAYTISI